MVSRTITFELSDALFAALQQAAASTGSTPEAWLVSHLNRQLISPARKDASVRLRQAFGSVHSGDANSADNERIDQDLARSYAGSENGES
jgi:hypothetical protein